MSSRDVPFEIDAICDECGAKGAFDFMGDYFCPKCLRKAYEEIEEDWELLEDEFTDDE